MGTELLEFCRADHFLLRGVGKCIAMISDITRIFLIIKQSFHCTVEIEVFFNHVRKVILISVIESTSAVVDHFF